MRNRDDHVTKKIGQKALALCGTVVANEAINPETQYADLRYEPDPMRQGEREQLGLLGRLASSRCLIEPYSKAPQAEDFRACLAKHLAVWRQVVRDAKSKTKKRSEPPPREDSVASFLWIIAAGAPSSLLTKLRLERAPDWPTGVYLFGEDVLRVGIIVASELPRDRTTLLVRLMAAGPLLAPAAMEVAALPPDACERTIAERILLEFKQMLEQGSSQTADEQEFIMAMLKTWEEGKAEARAEAQANAVLTVLRVRGIAVTDAARKRIVAEKDLEQLKRWHERAVVASSLGEVLRNPASSRSSKTRARRPTSKSSS